MSKKDYVSFSKLSLFFDNLKTLFATKTEVSGKANATHTHSISNVTNLQSTLDSLQSSIDSGTAAAGTNLGTVKSGGDVTISSGVITVNDDSHNHIISNVDGLQSALDGKSNTGHTHNDIYYTESEIDTKVTTINASISNIETGATVVAKASHAVNADSATSATTSEKAIQDGSGNVIKDTYETKSDASAKLTEAKSYADGIKNDLLNNAGTAYDTLKELGDLIDDNTDAIDALETVAAGKADKVHTHAISDVTNLQDSLDAKQSTITGGATTITGSNLTASRALVSDSNGKVAVSAVTSTELGYLDGVTSGIQAQLDSKSSTSHTHNYAGSSSAGGAATSANKLATAVTINGVSFDGSVNITTPANFGITTAGTGAAYTATVDGITALTAGISFTMIPHTVSTAAAPTLNVNSLGAKSIRRRLTSATTSTSTGYNASWLSANKPIKVTYDGTFWIADLPKPAAADISGTLPVGNGGTGLTSITAGNYLVGNGTSALTEKTPAEVLSDIGAISSADVDTKIQTAIGDAIAASY